MVQVFQEHAKRPSFRNQLSHGLFNLTEGMSKNLMEAEQQQAQQMKTQQENKMLQDLTGLDFDSLKDPAMRQKAFETLLQGQQKEQQFGRESEFKQQEASQRAIEAQELQKQKYAETRRLERQRQGGKGPSASEIKMKKEQEEKNQTLNAGLKTVSAMKSLRAKGNLGIGSTYSLIGKTRKDAAKYSQLGKSLIQLSSNIPIRNRQEFETLAHDLYDPNLTDEYAAGILDAMEQIIMQGLSENEGQKQNISPSTGKGSSIQGERQSLEDIFG